MNAQSPRLCGVGHCDSSGIFDSLSFLHIPMLMIEQPGSTEKIGEPGWYRWRETKEPAPIG